jgi:Ran-binding protein 9/10
MGRFITETGTASSVIREISGTYAAVVNDRILADTSGGAFTITLPLNANLLVNDTIQIIDVTSNFATAAVTLSRNGSLIQGATDDLDLDLNGASITLMYSGVTYGWIIIGT